jgi:hypothetical protein
MDDSANCGQCGNKCSVGNICKDGTCITGIGATYCYGKAINTSVDSANCGRCGSKCDKGYICVSGSCVKGIVGDTYCDGESVNIFTNDANCGQCGYNCNKVTEGRFIFCGKGKCCARVSSGQCITSTGEVVGGY